MHVGQIWHTALKHNSMGKLVFVFSQMEVHKCCYNQSWLIRFIINGDTKIQEEKNKLYLMYLIFFKLETHNTKWRLWEPHRMSTLNIS